MEYWSYNVQTKKSGGIQNMKMKKSFISLGVLLLCSLFLISFASALGFVVSNGVNAVTPQSGGVVAGSGYIFNVTNATNFNQISNCTVYVMSSLTANTTWSKLGLFWNTTGTMNVNGTLNSKQVEDGSYTMNISCNNLTGDLSERTLTGVIFDSYVPVSPTSLSPATDTSIVTATTQSFSSSVNDSQTTSCTLTLGRGGTSSDSSDTSTNTGTYSTTSCTYSKAFSTSADNGKWYWYMTASDGTNTSVSSTNTIDVQIPGAGGGSVTQNQVSSPVSGISNNLSQIPSWFWIVAIVVVLYLVFKKK